MLVSSKVRGLWVRELWSEVAVSGLLWLQGFFFLRLTDGTFLVTQLPKLHTSNAEGLDSIPSQGSRSHMLQLMTLHAATKIWLSQITNQYLRFSSVQFSHSVLSDSLRPHGLKHSRPLCPSPTPRVYSNSCPLSWWCHPTISSSVVPFSAYLLSFPASASAPGLVLADCIELLHLWLKEYNQSNFGVSHL